MTQVLASTQSDSIDVGPQQDLFHISLRAKECMQWQARVNLSSINESLDRMVRKRHTCSTKKKINYC